MIQVKFKDFFQKIKSSAKVSWWLALVLMVLAFAGGLAWGNGNDSAVIKGVAESQATSTFGFLENKDGQIPDYLKKDVDFNLFWEAWDLIKEKYYNQDIPETQLFYGALSGLVASLQDPYSIFLTPQNATEFQDELNGSFEGIGAEIGLRNGQITIVAPLPDTPAFQAGLKPRDIVLQIDDQDTAGLSLDQAVSLIRGQKDSVVALQIFRDGWEQPKEFKITRQAINVKSLSWEFKDGGLVYIKVRQFNDDTIPLFNDAIIDISGRKDVKGLILDLRYNPGGYLQSAIDMAGEWVAGQTVVVEKLRNGQELKHWSDKPARLAGYPTVVLVDGGSASGSEIVAGALQDYGLATLVGAKTFGKGSVQELTELPDGSSLKLTVAKWFTPQGRSIDEQGIEPDVKVELTEDDANSYHDPQLDKALELLKK